MPSDQNVKMGETKMEDLAASGASPVQPPPVKRAKLNPKVKMETKNNDKATAGSSKESGGAGASNKEEQQYSKMTHHEHILARPDTYVGTRQERKEKMFVLNAAGEKFEERVLRYCPALYKIFDEILVNAADHMQRDSTCDEIRVEMDTNTGRISVENNGSGVPVQMHEEQKIYIPELIFGNLLAGDNFNDDKQRVTGGRNGYGAKLTNIFSSRFELETVCLRHLKSYKQVWTNNMKNKSEPEIVDFSKPEHAENTPTEAMTKITFYPDWHYFPQSGLTEDTAALFQKRVYDIAGSTDKRAKIFLNKKELPIRTFEDFVKMHIPENNVAPAQQAAATSSEQLPAPAGAAAVVTAGQSSSSSSSTNAKTFPIVPVKQEADVDDRSSAASTMNNDNITNPDSLAVGPGTYAGTVVTTGTVETATNTTLEKTAADNEVDENEKVHGIFAREVLTYPSARDFNGKASKKAIELKWEVILAYNTFDEFKQISFVNSIRTYKGGSHVQWIKEQVRNIIKNKCLKEAGKKKIKKDLIKDSDIDGEIYMFVNALIVNPQFDSQSKETLNTKRDQFKTDTVLSDQFNAEVEDCAIIDTILSYASAAGEGEAAKAFAVDRKERGDDAGWNFGGRARRLQDVPKLEDANLAGTKRSKECTLILTEGDSAKALAVAGLSIVGRDLYGVFPLRGKPMNVRDAAIKDVTKNNEVKQIMKILGVNPFDKSKIPKIDDMRYGSVMVMADQDLDGSHIKGLLLNMFQTYFPQLLHDFEHNFLKEFITPIVKASKKQPNGEVEVKEFYSLISYEAWRQETDGGKGWEFKYYKGLGTSTSKEAKAYFSDLPKHKIEIVYGDKVGKEVTVEDETDQEKEPNNPQQAGQKMKTVYEDDDLVDMVFRSNRADDRKDWMNAADDTLALDTSSGTITVKNFINREMVQFSKYDLRRAIPSVIDGFKPSQRKILFACFKRKLTSDIKVAQLSGYVSEKAAYHHGEVSLQGAIVKLAQNFVGANNINLLVPSGQFGTRLEGGDDHASSRYIFTRLARTARAIFPEQDDAILDYNNEEGLSIEPVCYYPIIPIVLANGANGIGTGWSTQIPQFNPREIIKNVRNYIEKKPFQDMKPWYRGFNGSLELKGGESAFLGLDNTGEAQMLQSSALVYENKGIIRETSRTSLAITELPVGTWTRKYKEKLQEMLKKDEKDTDYLIADMKEHHTDNTVHFVLQLTPEKMLQARQVGLYKQFSLAGQISMSNMHCFDKQHQKIRKYESLNEILLEFCEERERIYLKRKAYLLRKKEQEILEMFSKSVFIKLVLDDEIDLEKKSQAELAVELEQRKFPKWKEIHPADFEMFEEITKKKFTPREEIGKMRQNIDATTAVQSDYSYLLKMKVHQLSEEKAAQLLQQLQQKEAQADAIRKTEISSMWLGDLKTLESALDEQDKEDGKEIAQAMKMNRKIGDSEDMTNHPCCLALNSESGKIKQILRQKLVSRAHGKNKQGKQFLLKEGFAVPDGEKLKLLGCHNFDTILFVLSDGMVISLPVISIKDDGTSGAGNAKEEDDPDAAAAAAAAAANGGKPKRATRATKKKNENLPRPVQDFLSFQDSWRAPYLSAKEIDTLKEASGKNKQILAEVAGGDPMVVDEENFNAKDRWNSTTKVVAMVPVSDERSWESDSLILASKNGLLLKLKLNTEFYQKQLVRGLQMMRLKPDDEISGACLVNEDDTLCLAKQDGSFLHTSVRAIRFGNKNGAGNKFSFLTKQKVSKELREKFKQAADPAKARKEFLQKSKPAKLVAISRVYNGGKLYDKTKKIQDKDEFLLAEGISKPSKILTASYFYAQWRIRQDLKEKDEIGESLLKAEKTIPRKLKVAINELYPKLTDGEKEKWVEKEQEDTKRFEEEMKVFKEKIKEHKQELRNNKFIKGERLKGTVAGSLAGGAKSYLFQADHLYAQDIAKNYEEKMPDLVEKMKAADPTMNTSSVNFLGRVFFVKKHIWPTVDEETKKLWGAESEKKIAALKEQDGAGSSAAVGAGDEQDDDPMLGLDGAGAVDEDGNININAADEEDGAENEDDDENDDDENENDEDDDVKSSGEDDEDGSDDDGKTTPRSNAAGEQGELGKSLAAAGVVAKEMNNNLLTQKPSKTQLKDKTCFLFITKKGRGQRIPVQQFAIERKTNTGRQIKTEPGDELLTVLVLHEDHFDNNQNKSSRGQGGGLAKPKTGEEFFLDVKIEEEKEKKAFNGKVVEKTVVVTNAEGKEEEVVKKEYVKDVNGKYQLALYHEAKAGLKQKFLELSEEEKKEWEEKAKAFNEENASGAKDLSQVQSIPSGLISASQPGEDSDVVSVVQNKGGNVNELQTTTAAAAVAAPGLPILSNKQRPHHEVLLLTSDGEACRIIPTTINISKGLKIAKSRSIAKLQSERSHLVDASYCVTWDVPEKASDRKARLQAERLAEKENRLETVFEDSEEEDEDE